MSLQVQGLTKSYGQQVAVNNISFEIGKGEIVGFLGPNGAGKSTTMKMITGYLQADAGKAVVGGEVVQTGSLLSKKKIGYLPESNALYYDMYIREYLHFIGQVHRVQNIPAAVESVITTVGLTPERHKKIGQLSKGYKQRVGLAAALIHNPELLILDEPTSGLDPNQIIEIRNVIKQQGQDKTVLFSSHILQEVEAICDRVIIINKGNLVADDRLSNLQSKKAAAAVVVSFKESLEPQWLERLPAAMSVEKKDATTWRIQTSDPEALRRALLAMAVEHNLNIEALQNDSGSLEDVFRTLTT